MADISEFSSGKKDTTRAASLHPPASKKCMKRPNSFSGRAKPLD